MEVIKSGPAPPGAADWRMEIWCDMTEDREVRELPEVGWPPDILWPFVAVATGCGSKLRIFAHDLFARKHDTKDPKEAVQEWYECSVRCGQCGASIFVPEVPYYVGKHSYNRNRSKREEDF